MSKLNQANAKLNTLNQGDKITICGMGEFGFPYVIQAKFERAEVKPWAQYDTTISFVFTPKGKRNARGLRIYDNTRITIYKDWIDLKDNGFTESKNEENGVTISASRYSSFDHRYINDIKKQTNIEPFVNIDPDEEAKTQFIYKICNDDGSMEKYYDIDSMAKNHEITGYLESMSVRKELREQPILKGVSSPMWDGIENDCGVIRYEGCKINEMLSY